MSKEIQWAVFLLASVIAGAWTSLASFEEYGPTPAAALLGAVIGAVVGVVIMKATRRGGD